MRLIDKRTGKEVGIVDHLVNDAIANGNYAPIAGSTIPVLLPDGTPGEMAAEEFEIAAKNDGFRYRTAEDDKAAAQAQIEGIKKEAYDKPLTAGALGVARGYTAGLSDVGLAALGLGDAAREVRDRSPIASTVGEIGGTIGAFVTPGVAGIAGAPTRAITALGETAAKTLIRGGETLSVAQKAGRALVGGAVEGLGAGLSQTISEAALNDPELTAQKAISNIGWGGVLGGGISLAGRSALELGKAGTNVALQTMARSEIVPKTFKEIAGRLLGEQLRDLA